jgi:hypothetical protein
VRKRVVGPLPIAKRELESVACGLPGSTSMQLCLGSRDSLVDASFTIVIASWRLAGGSRVYCEAVGPVLRRGQQSELTIAGDGASAPSQG